MSRGKIYIFLLIPNLHLKPFIKCIKCYYTLSVMSGFNFLLLSRPKSSPILSNDSPALISTLSFNILFSNPALSDALSSDNAGINSLNRMLEDKVEPIAEYGDEENGNKIDTSAIELDNADTFDKLFNLLSNVDDNNFNVVIRQNVLK